MLRTDEANAPLIQTAHRLRPALVVSFLFPLLAGLPFLQKPFHIDDPLFVWAAQHITQDPLNFYGFHVNWYGYLMPMHEATQNPPLFSYMLAPVGRALGWHERPFHLVVLGFAGMAGLIGYLIAQRWTRYPLAAALFASASPAVLVSSTTVMCDIPMYALWLASVYLWLRGLETLGLSFYDLRSYAQSSVQPPPAPVRTHAAVYFLFSGLCTICAVLTKYVALSLFPLLALLTVLHGRRALPWLSMLIVPLCGVLLYEFYTKHLYGTGLIAFAFGYASERTGVVQGVAWSKLYTTLCFVGALYPVILVVPFLGSTRRRALFCTLFTAIATAGIFFWLRTTPANSNKELGLVMQQAVWTVSGAVSVIFAGGWIARLFTIRSLKTGIALRRVELFLGLWFLGVFVFAGWVSHMVNARMLVPMALPLAILLTRFFESQTKPIAAYSFLCSLTLVLALMVGYADYSLATSAKRAAETIMGREREGTVWFCGHWGFQYYMETLGAKPLDADHPEIKTGDYYVVPSNNTNVFAIPEVYVNETREHIFPVCSFLTTMQPRMGAGYYSDVWGKLPFVFGTVPAEQYVVQRIGQTGGLP